MSRPKRQRKMSSPPMMAGFRPFGIPLHKVGIIELLFEEFETIKLADYQNLTQEQAAEIMDISRPTFTRIYEVARKKIGQALAEGKAIVIVGGNVSFDNDWYRCLNCNEIFEYKNADNELLCNLCNSLEIVHINEVILGNTNLLKPDDCNKEGESFCICVDCNVKIPHTKGVPCRTNACPQCGKTMMRENSFHHKLLQQK